MTVNDYKNAIDDLIRDANRNLSTEKFKDLAELVAVMGNAYLTATNTELEKVLGDINRSRRCYNSSDETLQSRLLEIVAIELAKLVDIVQEMK